MQEKATAWRKLRPKYREICSGVPKTTPGPLQTHISRTAEQTFKGYSYRGIGKTRKLRAVDYVRRFGVGAWFQANAKSDRAISKNADTHLHGASAMVPVELLYGLWDHRTENSGDGQVKAEPLPSRRNAATGVSTPGSPDSASGVQAPGQPAIHPAPLLFIIYIAREAVCVRVRNETALENEFTHAGRVGSSGCRPRRICHVADASCVRRRNQNRRPQHCVTFTQF